MLTVVESTGVSGLEQLHAQLAAFNPARALFIGVDMDDAVYLFSAAPTWSDIAGSWWGPDGDGGELVSREYAQRLGIARGGVGVVTLAFDAAPEAP